MSTINIVKLIAKPKDAISNYFSLILKLKNRRKGGWILVIPTGLRNAFALLIPLASKFAAGAVAFLAH